MLSRPVRFIALLLLTSDRRRLAATVLAPLLFGLSFGCGYLQAPRQQRLTDHAAMTLTLALAPAATGTLR